MTRPIPHGPGTGSSEDHDRLHRALQLLETGRRSEMTATDFRLVLQHLKPKRPKRPPKKHPQEELQDLLAELKEIAARRTG